jgi:dTDP-4-dehydrorhamnose reductase
VTWLITGAGGQLGSVLLRELVKRGTAALGVVSPTGPAPQHGAYQRLDLTDLGAVRAFVAHVRPHAVLHAAAVSRVAEAHAHPERARQVNAFVTRELVELCEATGARFVYVSTDMVFDGARAPYREDSPAAPLSAYGQSKRLGEILALERPHALVARLPLLYGFPDVVRSCTFADQVAALRRGQKLALFHDEHRTPLWLEDAATALIRVADSDVSGVLHLGGPERLSRLEMGRALATALGADSALLESVSRSASSAPEPRPADLSLDSSAYVARFGVGPGRCLREALPVLLAART